MKKTNNKGFSLVELIVVIAIMAVLVGVAAPTFTKYVERSRKSTDVQNAAAVITAIQTYAVDTMVADGDKLTTGAQVTLKYNAAPACTNNADKALAAAGISDVQLKSEKWAVTSAGTAKQITLTFTIADDGSVTVGSDCDTSKNDIIKGTYDLKGNAGGGTPANPENS